MEEKIESINPFYFLANIQKHNTFYINEGKKNLTAKEIALLTFQSGNKNIVLLSTPLK